MKQDSSRHRCGRVKPRSSADFSVKNVSPDKSYTPTIFIGGMILNYRIEYEQHDQGWISSPDGCLVPLIGDHRRPLHQAYPQN